GQLLRQLSFSVQQLLHCFLGFVDASLQLGLELVDFLSKSCFLFRKLFSCLVEFMLALSNLLLKCCKDGDVDRRGSLLGSAPFSGQTANEGVFLVNLDLE